MDGPSISLARPGYKSLWISLLLFSASASTALAAFIAPTNDTTGISDSQNSFTLKTAPMIYSVPLLPLTPEAGQSGATPKGTFVLVDQDSATSLNYDNIGYISCDDYMYPDNYSADSVFLTAQARAPAAIVLFTTTSAHCTFSRSSFLLQYTTVYSVTGANYSLALLNIMRQNMPSGQAFINISQNLQPPSTTSLVSSPTTTVAMIILYSITGVVTGLFLIIIATGAVRAHRHPELYGPRILGPLGVRRQSRAKGLARAVLESIPIVKFGEKEDDDKPPGRDLEMGSTAVQPGAKTGNGAADTPGETSNPVHEADSGTEAKPADDAGEHGSAVAAEPGNSTDESGQIQPDIASGKQTLGVSDDGLSCSICTEDFVKGEDIRVLPCNHKFHPDCIDPWLLNVSGTCPLCRIDLNPASSSNPPDDTAPDTDRADDTNPGSSSTPPANNNGSHESLPPPLIVPEGSSSGQPNRRSRYLDLRRLAHAEPEERLQAIRQLREVNQQERDADANRRRSRMSGLFRGFGIRSARSGTVTPPEEASRSAPAAGTNSAEAAPSTGRYPTRIEPIAPQPPAPVVSPLPHMERDRIRNSRFFTFSYANPHIL